MPETNDELLERLAYLRGAVWSRATWSPPSERWDHEHCVVCWARFVTLEASEEEPLREGLATTGPAGQPEYHWLCPDCFHAYREVFGWSVIS
jgi:hypothetical protein